MSFLHSISSLTEHALPQNKWWCETCYEIPENGQPQRHAEVRDMIDIGDTQVPKPESIKVHMGLCVENCLVGEMMSGAGSFGMWG